MLQKLNENEIVALREVWKRLIRKSIDMTIDYKIDQAMAQLAELEYVNIGDDLTITFDCKTCVETLLILKDTLLETELQ